VSKRDKRGNGQGTLYQRSGRRGWFGAVTANGKRKIVHAETKTEAAHLLAQTIAQREAGRLVVAPNQSTGAYLQQWLEQVVKPRVRPGTYRGYEQLVRTHLVPALGKTRLDRLAPAQVQAVLNAKLEGGLAPATVRYIRAVLRSALKHAVRWGLAGYNAAELVDGPRVEREEIRPFTPAQARQLLDAAHGDRLEALYAVALSMGLRQGEALGLRWEDVELDDGLIHVRRQLLRTKAGLAVAPVKTARGRRTLTMPTTIVETLAAHRQRQLAAGIAPTGYVFTTIGGKPLDARNVVRAFKGLLRKAALPDRRFHDLRHSAATLLLVQGVPARVVMDILGHSQIQVTLGTYSHVLPELHRDAADRMDAILRREPARP